jgi:hypothetical protein
MLSPASGFFDEARKRRAVECSESMRHTVSCAITGAIRKIPVTVSHATQANVFNTFLPILSSLQLRVSAKHAPLNSSMQKAMRSPNREAPRKSLHLVE